jgi:tetratricopeptide (TPR) repeat protein
MTTASEPKRRGDFVTSLLPWLLGAAMLAVYLLTFNHWASTANLRKVAELSGWSWWPNFVAPLDFLVTYPLRWLPATAIPLALNLFGALCAALTLALLARSVALLPHDRTHDQRERESGEFALLSIPTAWLPPVLAVLVCGLQLSFWEQATQGSSESFDLLIFAYLIRCLLEFRISQKPSWMNRFALIYGLSIAQNWAMVAFLPCALAAVIWSKGLRFFDLKFLLRSFWLWLAGVALLLLLPLLASFSHTAHVTFWQGLHFLFDAYKMRLTSLTRAQLLLLCLPSVLPIFVLAIRWPSYFGDSSPLGIFIATSVFRILHALFLAAGVWVTLGTQLSPRHVDPRFAFLPVSYLTSLSVGYFSGYFLLIFGADLHRSRNRLPPLFYFLNLGGILCLWGLPPVLACVLVCRNLPIIQADRSNALRDFFGLMETSLPLQGAVVLSDDSFHLFYLEALLDRHGQRSGSLLIDTSSLKDPNYLPFLDRQYPRFKLTTVFTNPPAQLRNRLVATRLLQSLSKDHPLYYLQPSFGDFFEVFSQQPHGLVYQLKPRTEMSGLSSMSREVVEENQAFWRAAAERQFPPLLRAIKATKHTARPDLFHRLANFAHLKDEPDPVAPGLGTHYSRALDYWGVQLQKSGAYKEAETCFAQARDLDPDNVAAQVNLDFSRELQARQQDPRHKLPPPLDVSTMEVSVGRHRKWDQMLNDFGPFDQPDYCYQLGANFLHSAPPLLNQAREQFERVDALAPGRFFEMPYTVLQLLLYTRNYPMALEKAGDMLRQRSDEITRDRVFQAFLSAQRYSNVVDMTEVVLKDVPEDPTALFYKGASLLQLQAFDQAIQPLTHLLQVRTNDEVRNQVFQTLASAHQFSNVLAMTEEILKTAPDNPAALFYKGVSLIQLQSYRDAIPPLTRLLDAQTNNYVVRLNRAIALFKVDDFDAASRDYAVVFNANSNMFQACFGLGEIAYRRQDMREAIKNYKFYLSSAPTNTDEAKLVSKRLAELERSKPGK